MAEKALEMTAPEDSSQILDTLARACQLSGNLSRAVEAQRQAVAKLESRTTPTAEDLVVELIRYLILAGDTDAAIEEARVQGRSIRGQEERARSDIAKDLREFGDGLAGGGLWPAAEVVLTETLTLYEGQGDSDTDGLVQTLIDLCGPLAALGRMPELNERLDQAEELVVGAYGEESLEHAEDVLYPIGRSLSRCDRGREAIPLFRRVIEMCDALGEDGEYRRRLAELRLAQELVLQGETREAMRIARSQAEHWTAERGEIYWATGWAKEIVGEAYLREGAFDSAEKMLREALNTMRFSLEERDSPVAFAEAQTALAGCLTATGQFTEAESLLLGAHELIDEYGNNWPAARRRTLEHLVTLYESWGKPAEAAGWRKGRNPDDG
jgi:tetratricopeptide (TPR) repeat protein